jgi:hypothetical protein
MQRGATAAGAVFWPVGQIFEVGILGFKKTNLCSSKFLLAADEWK